MDELTQWDLDLVAPGQYTAWDDVQGGPGETFWDLLPSILGRTVRIVWGPMARTVAWANTRRTVKW